MSDLQDVLIYAAAGISMYAHRGRKFGVVDKEIDGFVSEALFSTVTNVNFDADRLRDLILKAVDVREKARRLYEEAARAAGEQPQRLNGPAAWEPADGIDVLAAQAAQFGILKRREKYGETVAGLQDMALFGLKGLAAYVDHARILGRSDDELDGRIHEMLDLLAAGPSDVDALVGAALNIGELNLLAMELLDAAHTETYGHPVPTPVKVTPTVGKAILVSGHDARDLELVLEQTAGRGINVYTHGEMLPLHAYPGLKKYPHLAGHYGGAWQNQHVEFEAFPGAILMTTNCFQKPRDSYRDRIFTTGLVAWPGIVHLRDKDFTPVIEAATAAEGFTAENLETFESGRELLVGFGRNAVLSVADKVVEAVQQGAIRQVSL